MFCDEVIENNLKHQKKKYKEVQEIPIGIFFPQCILFFILFWNLHPFFFAIRFFELLILQQTN